MLVNSLSKKIFTWVRLCLYIVLPVFLLLLPNHPLASSPECQNTKIKVITDHKCYPAMDFYLMNGMGYLALDDISRIFDAQVQWYAVSKKVILKLRNKKVEFYLDDNGVIIGGVKRKMNKTALLAEGKVLVPLELVVTKAFSDVAGRDAVWNCEEKVLTVQAVTGYGSRPEDVPARKEVTKSLMQYSRKKHDRLVIVIDPGHGGKDPGAIGPDGIKEKDIVLDIGKRLAELLQTRLGAKVIMTRRRDRFIPLSKRTALANSKKADLFISIHTNSSMSPKAKGFETYFLSNEASDEAAASAARLENSVIKLEGEFSDNNEIAQILFSLSLNEFMNESSELCSFISGEATRKLDMTNRGVRQAGFHVLRGAQMPSVLVEVGFLSNQKESRKLASGQFRRRVAGAIATGVEQYLDWASQKTVRR